MRFLCPIAVLALTIAPLAPAVAASATQPASTTRRASSTKRAPADPNALRPGDVMIELENFALTDAPIVESEVASGGKAVSFPSGKARAETKVKLPRGDYTVELYLMGRSLDHDTVWVKVGDAQPAPTFPSHPRLPMKEFNKSMVGGRLNAVPLTIAEDEKEVPVIITPKETEMTLDRIIFRKVVAPKPK
jgi:hypothetical protein